MGDGSRLLKVWIVSKFCFLFIISQEQSFGQITSHSEACEGNSIHAPRYESQVVERINKQIKISEGNLQEFLQNAIGLLQCRTRTHAETFHESWNWCRKWKNRNLQ